MEVMKEGTKRRGERGKKRKEDILLGKTKRVKREKPEVGWRRKGAEATKKGEE